MAASGGSSNTGDRSILLRGVGKCIKAGLRKIFQLFDPDEDIIERAFRLIGEDSAVIVFTDAKYVSKAVRLNLGDVTVSKLPSQVLSNVTVVVDPSLNEMFRSRELWKCHTRKLKRRYGVTFRKQRNGSSIEISGGFLEVSQCKILIENIHEQLVCEAQRDATGDGKHSKGHGRKTGGITEGENEGAEMSGEQKHGESHLVNNSSVGIERPLRTRQEDPSQPEHTHVGGRTFLIASTSVHIGVGDIRQQHVDVIVNPTNQYLRDGKGVSHAIEIHNDLYCVFMKALEASAGHSSIAMPVICADMAVLSKSQVSQIFHKAVTEFCHRQDPSPSVVSILLTDVNREVVTLIQQQFDRSIQESEREARGFTSPGTSSQRGSYSIRESMTSTADGGHGMAGRPHLALRDRQVSTYHNHGEGAGDGTKPKRGGANGCRPPVALGSQSYGPDAGSGRNPGRDTSQNKSEHNMEPKHETVSASMHLPHIATDGQTHWHHMDDGRNAGSVAHTSAGDGSVRPEGEDRNSDTLAHLPPERHVRNSSHSRPLTAAPATAQTRPLSSCVNRGREDKHDHKVCSFCRCSSDKLCKPIELPNCEHIMCLRCFQKQYDVCPICSTRTAFVRMRGTQPLTATMKTTQEKFVLSGYTCGTIVIRYDIPDGIQMMDHPNPGVPYKGIQRISFLPDNKEGKNVLHLLQQAFRQRLIFTVGRSMTTGEDNCVTWNGILHKTSVRGGPAQFGYPDPDYLATVTTDLAAIGIV